jgi:putative ATP-binding cassette transporter
MTPPLLLRFLLRHSQGVVLAMTLAGVLSGIFSVAVIASITHALYGDHSAYLAIAFILLVAGKIVSAACAQWLLTRFSQGAILDLSLTLCTQILRAPLRRLEREGTGRILAVLTDDVSSVAWAVQSLPRLSTNLAVVLGGAAYLAWLSWKLFLLSAGLTIVGALTYKVINDRAFSVIREAREARASLFEHFRTLISGIKELALHRARREEFLNAELRPAAERYRRTNLQATARYMLADSWIQFLLYGLIGILLFAYPVLEGVPVEILTGYVLAILYVMAPLWAIIGTLPAVMRGQVALKKIEDLGLSLNTSAIPSATAQPAFPRPSSIELRRAVFRYERTSSEEPFVLGPIDFRLARNELVFVVGGNGSGKSTFAKVLTGLYPVHEGELLVDDVAVSAVSCESYREIFAAVFSDFHLFDKLLGIRSPSLDARVHEYLEILQINDKVRLEADRRLSTIDLSQGQRKRLALMTAYLEDRPFYVFDEWAADQDPDYKRVFYSKLLPDLRQRGKGVVVITHDDRFFHLGDRIVRLDEGKIAGGESIDDLRSSSAG